MADYSFSPQFANLSGLQPLPALDVTRGAALQFQPLQAIQIQSSRPELVAEGIASAVSSIAKGALGGITAKYEKEEEKEKEKRKFAHELMLYGVKEKSENADFFAKEEARWIAENSGKPGFAANLARFRKAYSGFSDRVPETKVDKEPSDYETVEEPLPEQQPELKANFETPTGDFPEERPGVFSWKPSPRVPQEKPALEAVPVSTTAAPAPVLEDLPAPKFPAQAVATKEKPLEKISTEVDYTKYEEPPTYGNIETDAEAQNLASKLNNQLKNTNPDYKYQVINLGKSDEFKTVAPVSIRKERLAEEQAIKKEVVESGREEKKTKIEEEKLDIAKKKEEREVKKEEREAKKAEQEMQIRQQKVKDENKVLADHVETAATSLREIDDIISTINNNPWSVGRLSASVAAIPIDTDAYKVRKKFETIKSGVTINALNSMRSASPTGAAVGNVSNQENEMFSNTEGPLDPSLEKKDILPVLEELKRKRLKIYNDSVEILKANNPGYTPPAIEYPKEEKKSKKTKSSEEMVRMKAPYQKEGKDVFGTVPKSKVDKKLSEGFTLAPLTQ